MHRIALAILLFLSISPVTQARVWEIHCFHGLSSPIFSPSNLHMNAGDTVNFVLDPACSVIEVSAASYYAGVAQWNGGFQTTAGGRDGGTGGSSGQSAHSPLLCLSPAHPFRNGTGNA